MARPIISDDLWDTLLPNLILLSAKFANFQQIANARIIAMQRIEINENGSIVGMVCPDFLYTKMYCSMNTTPGYANCSTLSGVRDI